MANCYIALQDYVICHVHIYQKRGALLFFYNLNFSKVIRNI